MPGIKLSAYLREAAANMASESRASKAYEALTKILQLLEADWYEALHQATLASQCLSAVVTGALFVSCNTCGIP